jgi:hypothetical protein
MAARQGDWCIGNTAVSKTATRGSTPRSPARRRFSETPLGSGGFAQLVSDRRASGNRTPRRVPLRPQNRSPRCRTGHMEYGEQRQRPTRRAAAEHPRVFFARANADTPVAWRTLQVESRHRANDGRRPAASSNGSLITRFALEAESTPARHRPARGARHAGWRDGGTARCRRTPRPGDSPGQRDRVRGGASSPLTSGTSDSAWPTATVRASPAAGRGASPPPSDETCTTPDSDRDRHRPVVCRRSRAPLVARLWSSEPNQRG